MPPPFASQPGQPWTNEPPPSAHAPMHAPYYGTQPAAKHDATAIAAVVAGFGFLLLVLTGVGVQIWQHQARAQSTYPYSQRFPLTGQAPPAQTGADVPVNLPSDPSAPSNPSDPANIYNSASAADRQTTISSDAQGNRVTRTTDSNGNVSVSVEPANSAGEEDPSATATSSQSGPIPQ